MCPKGMCLTGMHPKMHLQALTKLAVLGIHKAFCPLEGHARGICGPKEGTALFRHEFASEFLA